jgi:hypothetical protein
MEQAKADNGFVLCFGGVFSGLRNVLPSTLRLSKSGKNSFKGGMRGASLGRVIVRAIIFLGTSVLFSILFEVRVSKGYFGIVFCYVGLEVFFEVGFEPFEEFAWNGKVKAKVVVNALATQVSFP